MHRNAFVVGTIVAALVLLLASCQSDEDNGGSNSGIDPAAEAEVQRSGATIADNGTDMLGAAPSGVTTTLDYTMRNTGTATLVLSATNLSGVTGCTASVTATPGTSVAAGGSTTLSVQYYVDSAQPFSFVLSVVTNDSDENPYNWTVSGNGAFVDVNTAYDTVTFTDAAAVQPPATRDFTFGYGSGAYRRAGDPANVIYTITDRGCNIAVGGGADETGTLFAGFTNWNGLSGRVHPMPNFSPVICEIEVGLAGITVRKQIQLKGTNGEQISGLCPDFISTYGGFGVKPNEDLGLSRTGPQLFYDQSGQDPEGIVRLADGTFWICDEYGPSISHVGADGTILNRFNPVGVSADLNAAASAGPPIRRAAVHPNTDLFPDILRLRRKNRGFEGIAVNAAGTTLYVIMQNPLENPASATSKASSNARIFKIDISGSSPVITGEYVYVQEPFGSYNPQSGAAEQGDVRISEITWVANDKLVVDERTDSVTRLYKIDLSAATNIYNTLVPATTGVNYDLPATSPTLEQLGTTGQPTLAASGIVPAAKTLLLDSRTDLIGGPTKIEGVAFMDAENLLLVNDNDFGILGNHTLFCRKKIGPGLSN